MHCGTTPREQHEETVMKAIVYTNHGPLRMEGVDEADIRRQAANLTYGHTSVYRLERLTDDGQPVNQAEHNRNMATDAACGFPRY